MEFSGRCLKIQVKVVVLLTKEGKGMKKGTSNRIVSKDTLSKDDPFKNVQSYENSDVKCVVSIYR